MVKGVDFQEGPKTIEVNISPLYGGIIEVRIDKLNGILISKINITSKGEGGKWKSIISPVKKIKGVHDIYFVFRGKNDMFLFDWWQFHK